MRLAALLHVDAGPPQQGGGDSSSQSTWATGQERQNLAAALATLSRDPAIKGGPSAGAHRRRARARAERVVRRGADIATAPGS